jgi:hypothetical protein
MGYMRNVYILVGREETMSETGLNWLRVGSALDSS